MKLLAKKQSQECVAFTQTFWTMFDKSLNLFQSQFTHSWSGASDI